jgi:hypothetical protein
MKDRTRGQIVHRGGRKISAPNLHWHGYPREASIHRESVPRRSSTSQPGTHKNAARSRHADFRGTVETNGLSVPERVAGVEGKPKLFRAKELWESDRRIAPPENGFRQRDHRTRPEVQVPATVRIHRNSAEPTHRACETTIGRWSADDMGRSSCRKFDGHTPSRHTSIYLQPRVAIWRSS